MRNAYQFLKKHGLLVSLILGTLVCIAAMLPPMTSLPDTSNVKELYKNHNGSFEIALQSMYYLTIIGAILATAFGIRGMTLNFKKSYKVLILAGGIILIYFITGMMGDPSMTLDLQRKFPTLDASTVKMVDGSIIMLYVMVVISIIAAVFASVKGLFAK